MSETALTPGCWVLYVGTSAPGWGPGGGAQPPGGSGQLLTATPLASLTATAGLKSQATRARAPESRESDRLKGGLAGSRLLNAPDFNKRRLVTPRNAGEARARAALTGKEEKGNFFWAFFLANLSPRVRERIP